MNEDTNIPRSLMYQSQKGFAKGTVTGYAKIKQIAKVGFYVNKNQLSVITH